MEEKANAVAIPEVLAAKGVYLQKELIAETAVTIFGSAQCWPRRSFEQLHFGYEPVPEIYLLHEVFDRFFPPRKYLSQLRDDLADDTDIEIFLEALGCHIIPDDRGRQDISSELGLTLPEPGPEHRQGLVLICWDRIVRAVEQLGLDGDSVFELLHVVCFHEHSHAARESKLLRTGDPELLRREETIAQQETYMFLRNRGETNAIEAMRKLMDEQPNCYRIPIP